jgi:FkbH-like protein
VSEFLPMVAVPELSDDPSTYIATINRERYFETIAYSDEDRQRSRFYRDNAARAALKSQFIDITQYLNSLDMASDVGVLDAFHLPRMAQLINKSNQFHLTGTRYSEADLQKLNDDPCCSIKYYTLRDKFGDNGLIAVVVLVVDRATNELNIDTWVMSCRVLGRTMEEFIVNDIIDHAKQRRCSAIIGRYVASGKNQLVSNLYRRLGFEKIDEDAKSTIWRKSVSGSDSALATSVNVAKPPSAHLEGHDDSKSRHTRALAGSVS